MTESPQPILPAACSYAFKEWAGVRDALASGRQTIILRKGGIHEGPAGFVPEHSVFWLYPTHVHEAEQGLKPEFGASTIHEASEFTTVGTLVVVEQVGRIETLAELDAIASEHVWTRETTLKRFEYKRPGLWLLVVRVFDRAEPWVVEATPAHAGCKTWVPLESALPTQGLAPVLDEPAFAARLDRLRAALPDVRLVPPSTEEG